jgi:hypothetical protein
LLGFKSKNNGEGTPTPSRGILVVEEMGTQAYRKSKTKITSFIEKSPYHEIPSTFLKASLYLIKELSTCR